MDTSDQKIFADEVLNDIEKEEVYRFNDNKTLQEAVRKILLAGIYFSGTLRPGVAAPDPTRNFALFLSLQRSDVSNEQLGADLKACSEGIRFLQNGFDQLTKVKRPAAKPVDKSNPAR